MGNSKKTWKLINSLLSRKNKSQTDSFIIENCLITDKNTIANKFNDFFANSGRRLAESIPDGHFDFKQYHPDRTVNLHVFIPCYT